MKILRIRRGFTTNSSGANEFLPDGGVRPRVISDAGPPVSAPAPPVLTTVQPWGDAPSVSAPPSNATTIGVVSVVVAAPSWSSPPSASSRRRGRRKRSPMTTTLERAPQPLVLRREAFGGILFDPVDGTHLELDPEGFEVVRGWLVDGRAPATPEEQSFADSVRRELPSLEGGSRKVRARIDIERWRRRATPP